jgi:hypothetical protein
VRRPPRTPVRLLSGVGPPAATLRKTHLRRLARTGNVALRGMQTPGAGTLSATLTARRRSGQIIVAKAQKSANTAGRHVLRLRLTKQGRRLARRTRRVNARLSMRLLYGPPTRKTTATVKLTMRP